jgi:hypothetical protein
MVLSVRIIEILMTEGFKSNPSDFLFVIFSSFNDLNHESLIKLPPMGTCIKCWGLRASSLCADAKADAGQNTSNNHLNPKVLYMMLPTGIFYYQPIILWSISCMLK